MHNTCNALEISPSHPLLLSRLVEKLSSMKLIPGAKKVGDLWSRAPWACVCVCVCVCVCSQSLSCVWLFVTPWTVTQSRQAPQFMGFSRQEYWSGLPCPPPGDLPDPGIKLMIMWVIKSRGFRFGSSHYPTLSTFLIRCWWAEQAIYLFQRSFSIWKRRCAVNFGQGWLWNNEAS